jgi:tetratricopeptide (TPR) repeat protein
VVLFAIGCANPINQKTAANYHELGSRAERRGEYELAEENYSRALWNAKMGQSPASGVSMASYHLGRVKGYLCKYDEAEELLLEALRLEEEASGTESGLTSMRLFEIARLNADRARYDAALPYYDRAISIVRKLDVETSDPIGFANVLSDYAVVLETTGNYEKARNLRDESDRIRAAHAGERPGFVPQSYAQKCRDAQAESTQSP